MCDAEGASHAACLSERMVHGGDPLTSLVSRTLELRQLTAQVISQRAPLIPLPSLPVSYKRQYTLTLATS